MSKGHNNASKIKMTSRNPSVAMMTKADKLKAERIILLKRVKKPQNKILNSR